MDIVARFYPLQESHWAQIDEQLTSAEDLLQNPSTIKREEVFDDRLLLTSTDSEKNIMPVALNEGSVAHLGDELEHPVKRLGLRNSSNYAFKANDDHLNSQDDERNVSIDILDITFTPNRISGEPPDPNTRTEDRSSQDQSEVQGSINVNLPDSYSAGPPSNDIAKFLEIPRSNSDSDNRSRVNTGELREPRILGSGRLQQQLYW